VPAGWENSINIAPWRPVSRRIAWLVLLWPVLCVVLQRELNRLWQAEASVSASETRPTDLAVEA